ncbi:GNAT family N-acetyltransferase [Actinomadura nitritigenes]|uniref:GNAT family N-acetyltransferase n=1 Tax=Actinomadura nitritigenes TaxID=134602 RepID=UPI003D8CB447
MRFRWDWLSPVVSAPWIPTLGVVGPNCVSEDLFNAVLDVAGTKRHLPYDKDRRWSDTKDEQVILPEVIHAPGKTMIPAVSFRGHGLIKIYCYGTPADDTDNADWARKLTATYGARGGARLLWCDDLPQGAKGRLMLKTLTAADAPGVDGVVELADCPHADSFPAFAAEANEAEEGGFAFLQRRLEQGVDDGPVFVAVEDARIVGAIGPLSTMLDAASTRHQPPQYFTVLPRFRGRGHGRRLWRASMAWGFRAGARYKVLQAASGSAAEALYLSEGMTTLGHLHQRQIPALP